MFYTDYVEHDAEAYLDDTISRLKVEVSHVENCSKQPGDDSDGSRKRTQPVSGISTELDDMQPLYSETLVAYHRHLLMKALLRAISLGTYTPGSTTHIYGFEESLLPHCLCIIFRKVKGFGEGYRQWVPQEQRKCSCSLMHLCAGDQHHLEEAHELGMIGPLVDLAQDGTVGGK